MTIELTAPLKEELVTVAIESWDRIADEWLQDAPTQEMSAEEIRKVVISYVYDDRWWRLSQEQRDEVLVAAIPTGCAL
jgi:hypothetical protein